MRRACRTLCALAAALTLLPVVAFAQAAEERPALELSLDTAVERALENNVDIAVERYGPQAGEQQVNQARGVYDPQLTAQINRNSSTTPAENFFSGAEKVETDTWTWNFGLQQYLPTGGTAQLLFNNSKLGTNSEFSFYNPRFRSFLDLQLSQPLLRGRSIDSARTQIRVSKNNKAISDTQFRQVVVNAVATVKNLYWNLVAAIDNLDAQRKSLDLAKKLLEENQIRVRVGTLAPLDVVEAESEVASREEGVILAESSLRDAEDNLKRAIFPAHEPSLWQLRIVPTDRPSAERVEVDGPAAVERALAGRTDIDIARRSLDTASLNYELARAQTLPGLDLVATYGGNGVGGTRTQDDAGNPIPGGVPGGWGDATSQVFSYDYPTWNLGVNFSYPILNRAAKASRARNQIARDQSEAIVRRLELQIATEVMSAGRAVDTNWKRVASTQAARVLQERRLDAEQKKFAAGMSTNFLVTQAQRDLAVAEVAELTAIADYRKSLVEFERIQEAGVGGGSSTLSVSLGGGQSTLSRSTGSPTTSGGFGTNPANQ
jgi:outer membrane protein TolC